MAALGYVLPAALVILATTQPFAAQDQASPLEQQQERRFAALDRNRDGAIDVREWRGSAQEFRWLDRNQDNLITREEVAAATSGTAGAAGTSGTRAPRGPAVPRSEAARESGDCVASAPRIVDDIFQHVLGRSADAASAPLTQALASGRLTVRDVVAQVAKSPEHEERYYWEPVVANIYREVMQRDATPEELRRAGADLTMGRRSLYDVVAQVAVRATNNHEGAVRMLYQRLLGREPDPEGLQAFTALAQREGIEAVARQIVNSPEYGRRTMINGGGRYGEVQSYGTAVRALYQHVLGRDPDPVGLRELTRIAATHGFETVVDRMVTSREYTQMYGHDTVPGANVRYCGRTMEP